MSDIAQQLPDLTWRIHTANLLEEALQNEGSAILKIPFQILGRKLVELADLAVEINDPRLHLIMMDLTLYAQSDPAETPSDEITEIRNELKRQIAELEQSLMSPEDSEGKTVEENRSDETA